MPEFHSRSPVNAHVPDYIRDLVPYLPGKPIEETRRELGIKRVVKLASNENPLGPSPRAIRAVERLLQDSHRYPDGGAFRLKQALSRFHGLSPRHFLVGNGSNEIIDFLVRTYCLPGDAIVTSQAAFIAYRLCAQIHGVRTLEAPLADGLRFDLGGILDRVRRDERARVVFIANPNNPTGTYVTRNELGDFLASLQKVRGGSVLVALDYAYWEYVTADDLPDPLELARRFQNVLVLRTFSKVHGLAGLRIGYGISAPEIIQTLEKVRQPFNVSSLAMAAAEAALADTGFVRTSVKLNGQGLRFWEETLERMGVPFWRSQGNFILADVQSGLGRSGPEVYQACLRRGVILRPVANYGLPGALRISVGTVAENEFAARVLAEEHGLESRGRSRSSRGGRQGQGGSRPPKGPGEPGKKAPGGKKKRR